MKKIFILLLLIFTIVLPVQADSESLKTEITSVSMGPHDFGLGLAPVGTNFVYYNSFQMIPDYKYKASFKTRLIFSSSNSNWFKDYNYETGTPAWIDRYHDIENIFSKYYISGNFFKPQASVDIYLAQGFGTNPVAKEGPLVTLSLNFNSTYNLLLESLDIQNKSSKPLFVDPSTGTYREPYGPGTHNQAYPWLQDSRSNLVNNLKFALNLNFSKGRGFNVSDGVSIGAYIEIGPKWLGNNLTMEFPTSDYYKLYSSFSQNLTLYSKKQDNALNWLSIGLYHSNSFTHTGGSIVPAHKLPSDRLQNSISDTLSIVFYGPQFIAWDCYSDISLSLNNYYNFGHVANEAIKTTYAQEWLSTISMRYHLRLFGFMHFEYVLNYNFMRGIHCWNPSFEQAAKVRFYIAL